MKRVSTLLSTIVAALQAALVFAMTSESGCISYDLYDGLSNGYVTSMAEDANGQIWVATESGLNRFDGKRFITYTKENSGLPANELNEVTQDPSDPDRLWVATQRNGIAIFSQKEQKFSDFYVPGLESGSVVSIKPAADGGVWITNYHFGTYYYNHISGELREYSFNTIKGMPRLCYTSCEAPDGKLYIGHVNEGLSVVDTVAKTFVNYRKSNSPLPDDCIHDIAMEDNGYIWIGTNNGAAILNPCNGEITPFTHNPEDNSSIAPGGVRQIIKLKNGNIMFATSRGGICMLPYGKFDYNLPKSARFIQVKGDSRQRVMECLNVWQLLEDSHENLWIGYHRSGVEVITHVKPLFSQIDCMADSHKGYVYIPASSCLTTPDGKIWIGGDGEIVLFENENPSHFKIPGMLDNNKSSVVSIVAYGKNNLIAGTFDQGAYVVDPSDKSFSKIEGLPQNIRNITRDPFLGFLFATADNIYRLDGDKGVPLKTGAQLPDHVIQDIERDAAGNLWVGTFGQGLSILSPDLSKEKYLHNRDYFLRNAVNDIMKDSQGRMWVASRNGLAVFEHPSDIKNYKVVINPDNSGITHVMAIVEDKGGNFWATSDNGVIFIDKDDLSITVHESTKELPLNSFCERGACIDSKGTIYLASAKGMFMLRPQDNHTTTSEMPVVLSNIISYKEGDSRKENEVPLTVKDGKVTLPHKQNTFKISFYIPDQGIMSHSSFAYNMEGLDDSWIELHDENSVTFRSLQPGNYKFKVKSRFKGGPWNSPVTVVNVKILPPWWQSWWALTIYAAILIGIIVLFVYLYVRRIRLKERLMAEIARNQNRQELNEERLRFFTNITHELRTPLTLIMGPIEDMVSDPSLPSKYNTKLRMIRESSKSLLSLINGILEFRKTETQNRKLNVAKGNLSNLVYEISLRYKELNMNHDVDFIIDINKNIQEIYFDRDMISTMLNNILSNAVKYTPKGSITISLRQFEKDGEDRTEISVADTGFGMAKENISKIFKRYYQVNGEHQASGTGIGLALVKNIADLHEAEIIVDSEEGKGSTFTISLLTDNIYGNAIHSESNKSPEDAENTETVSSRQDGHRRHKILVVEDNNEIREYIRQSLEQEYDVAEAVNGLEGLKAVHVENPDIVVSDIMMPEMDGIRLCARIKEDILTSHIAVILLTAKDSLSDREAGYESGADSYLTKPFSAKLLRGRVSNLLLRRKRLAQSLVNESRQIISREEEKDNISVPDQDIKLSPLDRKFIDQIKDHVRENISNPDLDVQFIADKMCMSYSTLYRKSKSILGISMLEYIRGIRMAKAKEMIEAGELSISEIAYAVGYGGHSSFGKIFRKEFGMSPSEYQTKHCR